MHKLLTLLTGLTLASLFFYLLLSVYVFIHTSRPPSPFSIKRGFIRNATDRPKVLTGPSLHPETTLPPIHGAVRHYKSLLDNRTVDLGCTSCAVVSSSGYLLGTKAGPEIDRHSCVIRLNMAPVKGYEKDVGTRTSLRVMNFFMLGFEPETMPPNSHIMVWGLLKRTSYLENARNLSRRLSTGSTIHGQTHKGELEAEELFAKETGLHPVKTRSWISTGWFAMMIAIDICREIHVYGMVPSDYCARKPKKDVPYHYYETPYVKECSTYNKAQGDKTGNHRFISEKSVFARWAQRFNITFHYPSWSEGLDPQLFQKPGPLLETLIHWIRT
ncbi:alpha-N-acetylgalactosaminide alpha-2,6-sialyltransferase 6-like [Patiria miniata]|uniref:Uncharacterized protein n=1 Tax=Patiria miniata TaxID=46514 RepID=A0A913ZSD0_PATMI|nr:alpha-N-acetylgalactosaminide alpha-2,6-sialyltransferase 6-like [Patiria miniata]